VKNSAAVKHSPTHQLKQLAEHGHRVNQAEKLLTYLLT